MVTISIPILHIHGPASSSSPLQAACSFTSQSYGQHRILRDQHSRQSFTAYDVHDIYDSHAHSSTCNFQHTPARIPHLEVCSALYEVQLASYDTAIYDCILRCANVTIYQRISLIFSISISAMELSIPIFGNTLRSSYGRLYIFTTSTFVHSTHCFTASSIYESSLRLSKSDLELI